MRWPPSHHSAALTRLVSALISVLVVAPYLCESVGIIEMEGLPVEGDVHADVDVLPVPVVPDVVLGQSLPLYQFPCNSDTRVTFC